jgi:hypothetical protein
MHGLETLAVHQGGMFLGLLMITVMSLLFFSVVVGKK